MKVQDVILRALSGEMHWFRAADEGAAIVEPDSWLIIAGGNR